MPYIIAFVIIIVAAGALLLFRQPIEEAVVTNTDPAVEEAADIQPESQNNVPEGFTPPTTPPPTSTDDEDASNIEPETTTEADTTTETYTAEASYFTPNRTEHEMLVTLTLDDTVVVDANVFYDNSVASTPQHTAFDNAYKSEVIGQNINTLELSRVGGASLTSNAFNEAVAEVRAQL